MRRLTTIILASLAQISAIIPVKAADLTVEQKLDAAEQVYDRLAQAIGDSRPAPRLRIRSHIQVAMYWPARREIDLDERAFDLCQTMPDANAALAVLLGHELAHYYGNHGWTGEFGNVLAPDLQQSFKTLNAQDRMRCEMEADYFGGYYGYLAGYDTLETAPKLIDAIYQRYESMQGYPTKQEREEIAGEAKERLSQMIPVFECGNLLLALKQYEPAAICFDYIARDFPSREILNNAGVARAQLALSLLRADPKLGQFVYPFELDADTRLRPESVTARGMSAEERQRAVRLLADAEHCFDEAKNKDPAYGPAYVNLAGVYDLMGESKLAAAFADKAASVASGSVDSLTVGDALVMLAIVSAHDGRTKEAAGALHDAQRILPELAAANLRALPDAPADSASTQPDTRPSISSDPEPVANLASGPDASLDEPPYRTVSVTSLIADQPDMTIRSKETDAWQAWRIDVRDWHITGYATKAGFAGKTLRGIAIGDDLAHVRAAYGEPTDVTAGRQANLYRYDGAHIIFQISADQKVHGWTIYSIQ
jgi:tetratricopeptide (TPR) repeat protein